MQMFTTRKPEEVFTPRGQIVFPEMYISRPNLESALTAALRQPKHVVIHGESGSGKSWLYKNVFEKNDVHFEVINFGRVASIGSISSVVSTLIARLQKYSESGYSETKEATVKAILAEGGLSNTRNYALNETDPFETCLALLRKKAGDRTACLVFENLEHVVDKQDLVSELAGLLLLVDDENYSKYKIKIILVSTSSEIRSYISKAIKSNTVTNRLHEMPEVARLLPAQSETLIETGLFKLLKYEVEDENHFNKKRLSQLIQHFSDRIPQYLQELCLQVAILAEKKDGQINLETLLNALRLWICSSLISELSVVEINMNSITTKIGRKNQVIYCLGIFNNGDFSANEIEKLVRQEFPISCDGKILSVGQILSELANTEKPMIRKLRAQSTSYRFIDPKLKIVVRSKLFKIDGSENLEIRPFDGSVTWMSKPA